MSSATELIQFEDKLLVFRYTSIQIMMIIVLASAIGCFKNPLFSIGHSIDIPEIKGNWLLQNCSNTQTETIHIYSYSDKMNRYPYGYNYYNVSSTSPGSTFESLAFQVGRIDRYLVAEFYSTQSRTYKQAIISKGKDEIIVYPIESYFDTISLMVDFSQGNLINITGSTKHILHELPSKQLRQLFIHTAHQDNYTLQHRGQCIFNLLPIKHSNK